MEGRTGKRFGRGIQFEVSRAGIEESEEEPGGEGFVAVGEWRAMEVMEEAGVGRCE